MPAGPERERSLLIVIASTRPGANEVMEQAAEAMLDELLPVSDALTVLRGAGQPAG